jgi:hypothetical protein
VLLLLTDIRRALENLLSKQNLKATLFSIVLTLNSVVFYLTLNVFCLFFIGTFREIVWFWCMFLFILIFIKEKLNKNIL